jgi:adenosylcobinamide kinase/adenosylcobinamide-phosphate guanylyltransferase
LLLDCLSLWVSNRLMPLGDSPSLEAVDALETELDEELTALLEVAAARTGALIVVSNEVGGGVVPETPLGRIYRDLLGRANQRVAARAHRAWLLVAGRALELPPVEST